LVSLFGIARIVIIEKEDGESLAGGFSKTPCKARRPSGYTMYAVGFLVAAQIKK
jgi:hypothetical protein